MKKLAYSLNIDDLKQSILMHLGSKPIIIEPVLVLHDGPSEPLTSLIYKSESFQEQFNFIFYDQRGCGKTHRLSNTKLNDLSLDKLYSDLIKTVEFILEYFKVEKIHILSLGYSSMFSYKYVCDYPQNVRSYVVSGLYTNPLKSLKLSLEYVDYNYQKKHLTSIRKLKKEDAWDETNFIKNYELLINILSTVGGHINSRLIAKLVFLSPNKTIDNWSGIIKSKGTKYALLKEIRKYKLNLELPKDTNFCIIQGQNDMIANTGLARAHYNKIDSENKAFFVIKEASTLPLVSHPDDFFGFLIQWMSRF